MTERSQSQFPFEAHFSRQVTGRFDGSWLTTDGGGLLLRQTDRQIGLFERVGGCFTDHRQPERVEHELSALLAQRIYGLALGYEDLNDHEELRHDQLLGVLAGQREIEAPPPGLPCPAEADVFFRTYVARSDQTAEFCLQSPCEDR